MEARRDALWGLACNIAPYILVSKHGHNRGKDDQRDLSPFRG
jgi:hypothetical protein